MNNRYLYRAKRKNWRELPKEMWWVEGYLYGIWERRYILWGMINDVPNMVEVDPSTICQCTGLKDKNGKLIWENDIVKVHDDEEPCLIEWGEDTARWNMTQYGSCIYDFDNYWSYEVEVIGSAIDNPEILEQEG